MTPETAAVDPLRFTTIAHGDHVFCNPIGVEKIDRMLSLMRLERGDALLEVGCGKGELLVRAIERFGVRGVGVDFNPQFLAEARARAAARAPRANLELHECDFATFAPEPESFAAAACIGSSHACGGLVPALHALTRAVRPGGHVLLGDGYWKREPDPGYLEVLGATRDDFADLAGTIATGEQAGLTPIYFTTSNDDEWDHYEGLYHRAIERFVFEHPEDPDAAALLERIRRWSRAYLRWGRDTLGFVLALYLKGSG